MLNYRKPGFWVIAFCIAIAAAVVIGFLLDSKDAASDKPVITNTDAVSDQETASPDSKLNDTPANTQSSTSNKAETDISNDSEACSYADTTNISKHLAFVYEGNTIGIFHTADDQELERLLGKAEEIKSHSYSINDGENMDQLSGMTEKLYRFPGLVIKTIDLADDGKPFIFSIEITDPKYSTPRNIKVGDDFEKLREAYPEGMLMGGELSGEEDDFRFEPDSYVDVMNFHIKDKKIESISMYTLLD